MNFNEYQAECKKLSLYEPGNVAVLALGLCGEAGEVADKIKKVYRDQAGKFDSYAEETIIAELGDTLWYLARIADELGYQLDQVADINMWKLWDRRDRGVQRGSGDSR